MPAGTTGASGICVTATSELVPVKTPAPIRATDWRPSQLPVEVDPVSPRSEGAIRWYEVDPAGLSPEALVRELTVHCAGFTAEMAEDLLCPDEEPRGKSYSAGEIKLASSCHVKTHSHAPKERRGSVTRVGGSLLIRPVEVLAGTDWLMTAWHPGRVFEGPNELACEAATTPHGSETAIARRWACGTGESSGDLGTLLLHELSLDYADAHRALDRWLEDWELAYHHDLDLQQAALSLRRRQLTELWGVMAVLRDWIRPQNRTGLKDDLGKAWLPAKDAALVDKVDDRIDRALENIRQVAERLRASFGLVHMQQLEEARERRESLMRRVELGAALFLIPSLVVGFYGANTWIPGQGSRGGFWVMVSILLILSAVGAALVLRWQGRDKDAAATGELAELEVAVSQREWRGPSHQGFSAVSSVGTTVAKPFRTAHTRRD
jgi:hypothetical protein